ncbi:hypothetical protein [Sphingorhabdus sp.]|uniref:hypothetical protein n=1 Tax=Sphingorhabdus sp. TaxID=1902408 RepID=UPI00391A1256
MAVTPKQRVSPRLSASQLADYLVAATPIGQLGILRQAKNPASGKAMIIQYQLAKRAIAECLRNRSQINQIVAKAVMELEARRDNGANGPLVRDDAQRCIGVIQTFQQAQNQMDLWQHDYTEPNVPSPTMNIHGVEVSVFPDVVASIQHRGVDRVGQVFIRCMIGQTTDGAENRRAEANGHLATIAHMHTMQFLEHLGNPHAPTSMVIDVPRKSLVRGSVNYARRVANIETACKMIAAIWPTV